MFGVKPHRAKTFKLSTDPFFIEKVRDIVGLLPMGLGYVEGYTHDYVRHGTTTLFAALDIATGRVIGQCRKRHRHEEFLAFLRLIDREVPAELDIHLVLDSYATHKHAKVKQWLAARPRFHLHFTPTYASWLNQVERWFGLLSQRAIKRGSFRSVADLVRKIQAFIDSYNASGTPFVWVATAQSIIDKVARIAMRISGTTHWKRLRMTSLPGWTMYRSRGRLGRPTRCRVDRLGDDQRATTVAQLPPAATVFLQPNDEARHVIAFVAADRAPRRGARRQHPGRRLALGRPRRRSHADEAVPVVEQNMAQVRQHRLASRPLSVLPRLWVRRRLVRVVAPALTAEIDRRVPGIIGRRLMRRLARAETLQTRPSSSCVPSTVKCSSERRPAARA